MKRVSVCVAFLLSTASTCLQAATITPVEDVMTSSFFQGTNLVRGYVGDARPTFRVSSDGAFGLTGAEAIYLAFDSSDFAGFTFPVASAVLAVESKDGGFGENAGPGNPFTVSAHGVTADPFTSITDDTNPTGPISWLDFYNDNILAAESGASTVVDSFGPVTFDVTALVNDWLSGANTVFAIALTGKNDLSGNDFLHGFANNSDTSVNQGFTSLMVTQVPEPTSLLIMLTGGVSLVAWMTRPARSAHKIQ